MENINDVLGTNIDTVTIINVLERLGFTVENNNDTLTVLATFAGNDKYNSNVSAQKQFIVYKQNVTVSISDITEVKYGGDVFVNVNVPGATGNVTIKLNSTVIGTFAILDGNVNTTIRGLGAGNYIIYASYNGDGKYNMSTANRTFEVARATPEIAIYKAFTDANTAGNFVLGYNMAVLTLSNALEWGKLLGRGNKATKRIKNVKKNSLVKHLPLSLTNHKKYLDAL